MTKKVRDLLPKKEKGFTLIEIVLVLAIAGLIMVIVFLAVSGAQKSRRDTQRKNDLSRLLSQVEEYASNNSGNYPAALNAAAGFGAGGTYEPSNFKDPSTGAEYVAGALGTVGNYLYTVGAAGVTDCAGNAMTGARNVKLQMQLEQGVACVDNH